MELGEVRMCNSHSRCTASLDSLCTFGAVVLGQSVRPVLQRLAHDRRHRGVIKLGTSSEHLYQIVMKWVVSSSQVFNTNLEFVAVNCIFADDVLT
jgi:hypothetical protein